MGEPGFGAGANLGIFDGFADLIVQNQVGNGAGAVVAAPMAVNGVAGAGQVYDTVNNIPRPSRGAVAILVTDNQLNITTTIPLAPGFYFLVTDVTYSGAGQVFPEGATIQVNNIQRGFLVGSSVVPSALADDFTARTMIIAQAYAGDTYIVRGTAGINLGAAGSLTVFAIRFCGEFPL